VFDIPRIFPPKLVLKARSWHKNVTRWQKAKRAATRKAAKKKRRKRRPKARRRIRRHKPAVR